MIRGIGGILTVPPYATSVMLYDVGTSTPIGETIYADDSSGTTLSNPLVPDSDGLINFWLAEERELDVVVSCAGFSPSRQTITTDGIGGTGPQGPAGPQGPKGDPGATGATGPQGPAGTSYPDGGVDLVVDGGGSAITTGAKLDVEVPYNLTLSSMRLMADQSGSVVLDILKATYANFPGSATSICGASLPTLSGAQKGQDTTLTGWTKTLNKGDWLRIVVNSVTTIQRVTLSLGGTKF